MLPRLLVSAGKCTKHFIFFFKRQPFDGDKKNCFTALSHKWTNLVDNVPQLSAVVEYALGGGASTELQELMPGKKWIIFQTCLDRESSSTMI